MIPSDLDGSKNCHTQQERDYSIRDDGESVPRTGTRGRGSLARRERRRGETHPWFWRSWGVVIKNRNFASLINFVIPFCFCLFRNFALAKSHADKAILATAKSAIGPAAGREMWARRLTSKGGHRWSELKSLTICWNRKFWTLVKLDGAQNGSVELTRFNSISNLPTSGVSLLSKEKSTH